MLENYMDTRIIRSYLESRGGGGQTLPAASPLIIYMDPVDEDKVRRISLHQKMDIRVSEYFMGGTRAVIPSKIF